MNSARRKIELQGWSPGGFLIALKMQRRGAREAGRSHGARRLFELRGHPSALGDAPSMSTVRTPWRTWWHLAFLILAQLSVAAQETNRETASPSRLDFTSFKLITERNIFNASRSGRQGRGIGETRRVVKVDSCSLVGTMSYEKGWFAFFDGTSSDYRKTLQADGTIAGYKLTAITPIGVTLEREGKKLELRVGMQLRREDEGEWQVTERSGSDAGSSRLTASGSGGTGGSTESPTGDAASEQVSDVLKKLMQQREQETK